MAAADHLLVVLPVLLVFIVFVVLLVLLVLIVLIVLPPLALFIARGNCKRQAIERATHT